MAITMPASVTGSAQTGFTTPGYTLTADTPPNVNSKQSAVTALTGTQTGVSSHSASSPFTITVFRPQGGVKTLPQPNPITGKYKEFPTNSYKVKTRKGAAPAADVSPMPASIDTNINLYAGQDTYSPAEIRAMLSAHIGFLSALSASIGDTAVTAIL